MSSILLDQSHGLIAATPSFEVQTLDGQTLKGPLVELTADRLSVDAPDGPESLETAKAAVASPCRSRPRPAPPPA